MEGTGNTFNVTKQAFQYLTQAYAFCYDQLQQANITLPPPDQVLSKTTSLVSYVLAHSPSFVQQLYSALCKLPIPESNYMTMFLTMVIAYMLYCSVMATFRWMYRLVYGFVRFSFIMTLLAIILYVVQQYLAGVALFPGSTTANTQGAKLS